MNLSLIYVSVAHNSDFAYLTKCFAVVSVNLKEN